MKARPYQKEIEAELISGWSRGIQNQMPVLATGGGKSFIVAEVVRHYAQKETVGVFAHRGELVGQLSVAMARAGVRHTIIGQPATVKLCVAEQMRALGTHFYNPQSRVTVASVDTILSRPEKYERWLKQLGLWTIDEGHHILRSNKWGSLVELCSEAKGMAPTATPCRADRKGLGRHADGVIDRLVLGPEPRFLIENGWLSDYRVVCPTSDIQLLKSDIGSTGDYTQAKLKAAARKSHIVGDVTSAYMRFAKGKRTIVFATDIETANDIARDLRTAGIRAECVSSETDPFLRADIINRFRLGSLDVLVNVDLFGEGFDVPAVECVIKARPTESYALYSQQFGRALRVFEGKDKGLIIDMVGNWVRHGPPDAPRIWTLDAGERTPRTKDPEGMIPQRICTGCSQPYVRYLLACPYCGTVPTPTARGTLEQVDGDLAELDPAILQAMRKETANAIESPAALASRMRIAGADPRIIGAAYKNREVKLEHVHNLQHCIAWWAQVHADRGLSERELDKLFWLTFGVDRYSALTLDSAETQALAIRVTSVIGGLAA